MYRRAVALLACALVFAGACAKSDSGGGGSAGGANTRTVQIDATPKEFSGDALAYFPKQVTVHPGDTIDFKLTWTGEPHSVTMGTLVEAGLDAVKDLKEGDKPPEAFSKLPVMLPEGPGDANQVAVNPCYIASGDLPADASKPCPKAAQPAFDGKQAYYNSGFIAPGAGFEVQLADTIAPGAYRYYCNLHLQAMQGEIVVAEKSKDIPSQADVDKEAQTQIDAAFKPLVEPYGQAKDGKGPFGTLAGLGVRLPPGSTDVGVVEFLPSELKVKAGEKIAWTIIGPHTITFNPPADVPGILQKAPDGTFHLVEKAMAPAGGPGMPPPKEGAGASSGQPKPEVVDAGTWDGSGFRSSGFFLSFPQPGSFFAYSMAISKPGTYRYSCIVHPAMTGSIEVS